MDHQDATADEQKQNTQSLLLKQSEAAQNISLQAKFLCGLKGDVRQNVYYLEEQQSVLYPCGHNIVIYNIEDKSQKYIQGIEGSEGISAIALSYSKKFLAVAEKAERAICCVYDVQTLKRRKILTSTDYNSKEFVSVNFAPTAEKTLLVTLTAEPDIKVILWTWDKAKCFIYQQVTGISGNMSCTQVSFGIKDQSTVLVTGNSTYKFYKISDNQMKIIQPTISTKESHVSNNYTCHTWLAENKILVCTDQGDIMLLDGISGEYKLLLQESPGDGFYIECIQTYSKGFIVAGDNGQIFLYDKNEDPKGNFTKVLKLPKDEKPDQWEHPQLLPGILTSKIKYMAVTDEFIIFTTENNQLMKISISLERPTDDVKYEYLISPFHSRSIQGMDICIKKNLVATCSIDKTVRIWNNSNPPSLEICELFNDEAYSLAFHPSGFHLIVGFTDRVRMMNVFKDSLKPFQTIGIKGCREIRFSNGGHLFACASQNHINVYKFYTGENNQDMIYKAHLGPVRCLNWFDDDSGFISGGWDGNVYTWNLYLDKKDPKDCNPKHSFSIKNFQFACVANKPDSKSIIYAAGIDKTIKTIDQGKLVMTYEAGVNISQIQLLNGGRAIFAGVHENDRPGSIQIINFAFQKIFEIQAHSLPVERIRISHDNQYLFSAGQDGMFGIYQIIDKDPQKKDKEYGQVQQSDEILIEKKERDKFQQDIEKLKNQIEIAKQEREVSVQQDMDRKSKKINELQAEIENKEQENNQRYDQLLESKKEMERFNKDKLDQMRKAHEIECHNRKVDYASKQDADQERFNELQAKKDQDTKKFEERLNELSLYHEKIIKELKQDQKIQLDRQVQETNRLNAQIDQMMKNHKEERERIENETWDKIDILKNKNKEELAKIIDQGMQSKCNLTLVHNDFKKKQTEKEQKENEIKTKQDMLNTLYKNTSQSKQQILSQKGELLERDMTIKDKDRRILDLRKKTQELEKFKFVLDYKIKELKRDIGPRELEIQELNEQTNKMRQELKHFNRVNQNLALIVDDLRMKQEGLTNEVQNLRKLLDLQEAYKKKFKDDVYECLHNITDFKKLKAGVIRLHKKYVKEEVKNKNEAGDSDMHREYANKRRYLENNVNYLRLMLQKDQDVHKKENQKIMNENVELLSQINEQRKECHDLAQKIKVNKEQIEFYTKGADDNMDGMADQQLQNELRQQEFEIQQLSAQINEFEQQNEMLRQQKPHVGRMPPLDQNQYQNQYDEQQMPMDMGDMDPEMNHQQPGMQDDEINDGQGQPDIDSQPELDNQDPNQQAQNQDGQQE